MILTLMLTSMIMSMIFTSLKHPISLGLILLIQTMLIALISSYLTYSFWLSYILFLVMVGGMLILFTYVTSIASNEQFSASKYIYIMMMLMLLTMILTSMADKTFIYQMMKTNDMMNMMTIINFMSENNIVINKIYNKPNNIISIMLITYLLLTLIIVVKITNMNYGPLRQKF